MLRRFNAPLFERVGRFARAFRTCARLAVKMRSIVCAQETPVAQLTLITKLSRGRERTLVLAAGFYRPRASPVSTALTRPKIDR